MKKILFFLLMNYIPCHGQDNYLKTINATLKCKTIDQLLTFYAEDYRFYFIRKEGEGTSKAKAVKGLEWDYALHPDLSLLEVVSQDKGEVVVRFHEENDFTKLLGFPGWDANMKYTFDEKGLIREKIYYPNTTAPDYVNYFKPAVEWLKENKPTELNEVYKDKKLIQNAESAKKWVELLKEWRKATKQEKIRGI
jgi:hypothetical protein